jgi:hypothetical protein
VQALNASDEERGMNAAVVLCLEHLEALAVSTAAGQLTPALLPALSQTLACVRDDPQACTAGITGVWSCLADLFCSTDLRAAQVLSF